MLAGKHFLPWATDASELLSGKSGETSRSREWIRKLFLVTTAGLEGFEGGLPVVASPRGHGKSAIIARLAVKLLDSESDYVTLSENSPFVNELASGSIVVKSTQIAALISHERWTVLWQCSLLAHIACMVLRSRKVIDQRTGDEFEKTLKQHFHAPADHLEVGQELSYYTLVKQVWDESRGHVESIAPNMTLLIDKGVSTEKLKEWVKNFRRVILTSNVEVMYTIFVDAIDEALGDGESTLISNAQGSTTQPFLTDIALKIWLSAQKGFLIAIHQIRNDYRRVRIYGSVRIEALRSLTDDDYKKLGLVKNKAIGTLYAELRYTETELRNIFDLNVLATDKSKLAEPESTDPIKRLFGFTTIRHRQVYGEVENMFDLILRHTFGSPRDLVAITKKAIDSVTADKRATGADVVIKEIDKAAASVCEDWFATVMPVFDKSLRDATMNIPKNVIRHTGIANLETQVGYGGLFNRLYSRGLVGYPATSSHQNSNELYFNPPDGTERELPKNIDYIALHPSLSALICQRHQDGREKVFYSHEFIVGDGRHCPLSLEEKKLTLDISESRTWCLSLVANAAKTIHLFDEQDFFKEKTPDRRNAGREILCAILLAKKRQCLWESIKHEHMKREEEHLKHAGMLQQPLESKAYSSFLAYVFNDYKFDLIKEISDELSKLDLGLRFHNPKGATDDASKRPASIDVCWRNGYGRNHRQWTNVSPREIGIVASQNRVIA